MTTCDPRTVLLTPAPSLLRGRLVTAAPPVWPAKDPSTTVARAADFSPVLGNRIIASVGTASSGVSIAGATTIDSLVTVLLTGGTDGVPARVEIIANCSDGTSEPAAIILPIVATLTLPEGDVMPTSQTTVTTGTTPGSLGPIPILAAAGAAVSLRGPVVARNPATGDTASWDLAALIKGWGTPQAAVGEQGAPSYQADPALAGCTLAVAVSGSFVTVIVTGVAGAVLTWSCTLTATVA